MLLRHDAHGEEEKKRQEGRHHESAALPCVCARRCTVEEGAQQSLIAIAGAQGGNVLARIPWPVDQGHFLYWWMRRQTNEQQFKGTTW